MQNVLANWFRVLFLAVCFMVILGGTTRLTGSGLSIVDWRPVTGIVPPISASDWQAEFQKYQTSPEFQKRNFQLDLSGFQKIFFWEYFHRLWGRILGFLLVLPALWFWRRMDSWLKRRIVLLFLLLGFQGLMGWLMVKSGLLDRPEVSHVRLAIHFLLAVLLMLLLRWTEWEIRFGRTGVKLSLPLVLLGGFLLTQVTYGAFLAGTKAGWAFSTFPTMNGKWFPDGGLALSPLWTNFWENGVFIHWFHRALGTIVLLVGYFLVRSLRARAFVKMHFLGTLLIQYVLGISLVVLQIPIALGVTHQFFAVLLLMAFAKLAFENSSAETAAVK